LVDELMLEVSADICTLFNADRLTIYSVGEDKQTIVSKVKTGLNSFKDLKLPIAEHSIAGYVALVKQMMVAPIVDAQNQELVGVIQLINNKAGLPFGSQTEEGVAELAQTLAIAL